jgi:Ca-activated chloride channel family protein
MRPALAVVAWTGALLGAIALALAAALGEGLRHVVWAQPAWALAVAIPLGALALRAWRSPRPPTLRFSRAGALRRVRRSLPARLVALPDAMRVAAGILLAVALARPQSERGGDRLSHAGIDIVIVLDLSESMETPDLPPNRLVAAQLVIDDFIARRPQDRIGLVAFGSTASTIAPLTMDHGVLRSLVRKLRLGIMDGSTTAIGAGLGMALNRLEESDADSQVVVLLTDGVHNADGIDPDTAATAASDRGVRVFTVLMGQHELGPQGSVDPARLERMASVTGGYAYTAADTDALRGSFQDLLDKLERSTIEGTQVRAELFQLLVVPALVLLVLDALLRSTWLRRFP